MAVQGQLAPLADQVAVQRDVLNHQHELTIGDRMKRRAGDYVALLIIAVFGVVGITALVTLTSFTEDSAWLVIVAVIALTKWMIYASGIGRRPRPKVA